MRRVNSALIPLLCLVVQGGMSLAFLAGADRFAKYTDAAHQALSATLTAERLVDLSPLYLAVHKLAALLPGMSGMSIVVIAQLAAMAMSSWLLYGILQRFVPTWLAAFGTSLFILNRSVVVFANIFEPEALFVLFLLGFLFFILKTGGFSRLAAGCFFALCLLTRPNLLPFLVIVPIWLAMTEDRAIWGRQILIFLSLPVLALLLLSARNAYLTGEFTPVVMNPGYVFFEGNNPLSTGQSAMYPPLVGEMKTEFPDVFDNPHVTYRELARRLSGTELSISGVNDFWAGKAMNFIVDHPGAFLKKLAVKAFHLLHSNNRHDLNAARVMDLELETTWVPFIPFSVLSVFGLFGLFRSVRDWKTLFLPAMVLVSQAAVMLMMYVSDRQRLPLVPIFILFACIGFNRLLALPGRWRVPLAAAFIAVALWLTLPTAAMQDSLHVWKRYEASDRAWVAAVAARNRNDWPRAADQAAMSLGNAPWLKDYSRPAYVPFGPDASAFARSALRWRTSEPVETPSDRFDRAQLMLLAGRTDMARDEFDALAKMDATFDRGYLQSSDPGYGLAWAEWVMGDRQAAIRTARETLKNSPGDPFVLALLAAYTEDGEYERQISRYFSRADADMLIGTALLEAGRPADAARHFESVLRILPELRRVKIYLAAAWGASGRSEQAVSLYETAVSGRVDPVLLEGEIVPVYRRYAADNPGDPVRQYAYGAVLAQYGHLAEALREQRSASEVNPNPEWLRSLEWLQRVAPRSATAGPQPR